MGSVLDYIEHNPKETQRLIGIKYEQLQQLIQKAQELNNKKLAEVEAKKTIIISSGGGRKPKLSLPNQIVLTLVYLRHLTIFQLLGIQFGVSESTANDTFNYWEPLLPRIITV
jgi:hypothetical protein